MVCFLIVAVGLLGAILPKAGAVEMAEKSSSILVTGAAGFIGSHLLNHLGKEGYQNVVGLDSFNSYYTPAMKRTRAAASLEHGMSIVDGSVCDALLLASMFAQYNFTHVVHLAAQAGVRYSLEAPLNYIKMNVECFAVLLEQIRAVGDSLGKERMPHLLFASSSSVYGGNKKIPFSEEDAVTKPANLYGATKRMNELQAYAYWHLFGIRSVGFRFFTVYGPSGRPDMAAFIFTERMMQGQQITIYNEGKMQRDFTYVDDIVAGVTAALAYSHDEPVVFNLGNHKPVETLYFVQLIEKSLGTKADIVFEDSKAEIPITYANTTLAQVELGYVAQTSIEQGIERFIDWFKDREKSLVLCEAGCSRMPGLCSSPQGPGQEEGENAGGVGAVSVWGALGAKLRDLSRACTVVVYTFVLEEAEGLGRAGGFMGAGGLGEMGGLRRECAFVLAKAEVGEAETGAGAVGREETNWTFVALPRTLDAVLAQYVQMLKITPGVFFSPSVQYAVYLDSRVGQIMSLDQIVGKMTHRGSDGGEEKAILMLQRPPSAGRIFRRHKHSAASNTPAAFNTQHLGSSDLSAQVLAYREYEARYGYPLEDLFHPTGLYDQPTSASASSSIYLNPYEQFEPTLIVHDLLSPEGASLRCDWSHEAEEWSQLGGSYLLAGMFTVAKRQHVAEGGRGRKGKRVVEEKEEADAEEGWVKISNNPPTHVRLIS